MSARGKIALDAYRKWYLDQSLSVRVFELLVVLASTLGVNLEEAFEEEKPDGFVDFKLWKRFLSERSKEQAGKEIDKLKEQLS